MSEFKQTPITFYSLENCAPCERYAPIAARAFKDKDFTLMKVLRSEQDVIEHLKIRYNMKTFPFMVIGERALHSGETALLLNSLNIQHE